MRRSGTVPTRQVCHLPRLYSALVTNRYNPAANEQRLKREPEDDDFAPSHSAWHSATPEAERSLGLPDRKILLNNDDEGLAKVKVKVEDEDVEMGDVDETKPSHPQDLPFSLPFLASTSGSRQPFVRLAESDSAAGVVRRVQRAGEHVQVPLASRSLAPVSPVAPTAAGTFATPALVEALA